MSRGIDTLKAGLFISVALFFFVFSIFYLGKEREIFSSQANYYVSFSDVKGLAEGAPVRLGGVIIGRVAKIEFASNTNITVTLSINEKHIDKIRSDSSVSLVTQGLLGDKFASISVGVAEERVGSGGFLKASADGDMSELMGKASKVVDNTVLISDDLKSLTQAIGKDGAEDLKVSIKEFRELVKSLNEIANEIKNGDGLANAIIYDKSGGKMVKSFSDAVDNIDKASKNLKEASDMMKNGNGTLGALLVDSKLYDSLVDITDGAQRNFILRQAVRSSLNEK
jgi:phospholipid/cholesterol/gamma-HCH transport system substrate-binding protein